MIHLVVCTKKKKKKKNPVQLDLSSPESSSLCDFGFDLAKSGIFLRKPEKFTGTVSGDILQQFSVFSGTQRETSEKVP